MTGRQAGAENSHHVTEWGGGGDWGWGGGGDRRACVPGERANHGPYSPHQQVAAAHETAVHYVAVQVHTVTSLEEGGSTV